MGKRKSSPRLATTSVDVVTTKYDHFSQCYTSCCIFYGVGWSRTNEKQKLSMEVSE
jgi:hypothetical protein